MSLWEMHLKLWMMSLIASGNKSMQPALSRLEKAQIRASSFQTIWASSPTNGKAKTVLNSNWAVPGPGAFPLLTWKCSKQAIVKKHNSKPVDANGYLTCAV